VPTPEALKLDGLPLTRADVQSLLRVEREEWSAEVPEIRAFFEKTGFVEEVRYIETKLASLGAPKPISFAYPAYVTSPDAARTLRELGYVFARTGGNRAYDPAHDDPMLVPSWTTGEKNREEILRAFGEARNGRIVVLTIHGVPDTAHPWVNTPVPLFEEYLRFLHDNGYHVVALRDLARYLPAH